MVSIRTVLGQKPNLETELLLCYTLNKTRVYLFAHSEELLTQKQWETYQDLMRQRAQGMPIAYLLGEREFWSLKLKVNKHTLIPRHETERLVEVALEYIPNQHTASVLELGTGSGAVALALAKERPKVQIIACDVSEQALLIAQENAQNHKIDNVTFYQSDWFNNIPKKQYHAVLANPPYIAEHDPHLQEGDLCFEPRNALVSSQDGFADLHYIMQHSREYLVPGGLLLLEHGFDQRLKIHAILNKLGYTNVRCWQDIQNHDRISGGWFGTEE